MVPQTMKQKKSKRERLIEDLLTSMCLLFLLVFVLKTCDAPIAQPRTTTLIDIELTQPVLPQERNF